MDLKDLLDNWGFSSYFEVFKENKIDIIALKLLNFEALANLIPPIEDRLKFLKNVENLKINETENNVQFPELSSSQGVILETEKGETLNVVLQENSTNSILQEANADDFPQIEFSDFPNVVREYLNCVTGRRIVSNYFKNSGLGKKPFLDEQHQNLLVDLIITGELKDAKTELTASRFKQLATNIVEIFPHENECIYFIPYSSVKINNKVIKKNQAQGKLWRKYSNICRALRKDGLRTRKKLRRNNQDTVLIIIGTPETISGILLWLERQLEITETLKTKWMETAQHRLNSLLETKIECNTFIKRFGLCLINNYFLKYPFLRQPGGYNLLELDFSVKYPDYENKLFEKWPAFKEKVIQLSGEKEHTDWTDAAILSAFCNIVVQEQKQKRICSNWVANREEIKEGFLLHIKSIDSYQAEVERITKRALEKKLHVSPFAIIVGLDIQHITDSYIQLDGVQFRVASPKHAIDLSFKAVHALHLFKIINCVSIFVFYILCQVFVSHSKLINSEYFIQILYNLNFNS